MRLPFAGSQVASCRALVRADAHLLLGEGQGLDLATFMTPVQKNPA
jgi:hypothetical protein